MTSERVACERWVDAGASYLATTRGFWGGVRPETTVLPVAPSSFGGAVYQGAVYTASGTGRVE